MENRRNTRFERGNRQAWLAGALAACLVAGTPVLAPAQPHDEGIRDEPGQGNGRSGTDRYGGVWHAGVDDGPFVPAHVGMTFTSLQSYKVNWGERGFRIDDFEIKIRDCTQGQPDWFASKWVRGSWADKFRVFASVPDMKTGLQQECAAGYVLEDFEIWPSACGPTQYVALLRSGNCALDKNSPNVILAPPATYPSLTAAWEVAGYYLKDFEADAPVDPGNLIGVFYKGQRDQEFALWSRPGFENEMRAKDGKQTLVDMESFRMTTDLGERWRAVAALWEVVPGSSNEDDHEVGEVYSKFKQLLFMEQNSRVLADFEIYQDTVDERFNDVFGKYLAGSGGGWAFSVVQSGEEVASAAGGEARLPSNPYPATMTVDTRGPVASVTKFFTALGVLRFADTQPAGWIDLPIGNFLPPDFVNVNPGVAATTFRQLLTQRSGLLNFATNADPATQPALYRQNMITWLQQPLAFTGPNRPFNYQNVHFELLLLIMDEVVLPQNSPTPWDTWMNQQVFANAGVGPLTCAPTQYDALSYAWGSTQGAGEAWAPILWPCDGYGSGVGMFWASASDLARVGAAVRAGKIVSPGLVGEIYKDGFGLDWFGPQMAPYGPQVDANPVTTGEQIHSKNGGLGGWDPIDQAPLATETLLVRYDDYDANDDCVCAGSPICTGCSGTPSGSEYDYELGYQDFDVGIMAHVSPFLTSCPTPTTCPPRQYPFEMAMIQEAMQRPERW